jgi:magnesium-transporting ATPase (P-type)
METARQETYRIDFPVIVSAVAVFLFIFIALYFVDSVFSEASTLKEVFKVLVPAAAIPLFHSISTRLRDKREPHLPDGRLVYRNMFISAIIIALLLFVALQFLSLLAGMSATLSTMQLTNGQNPQVTGVILQNIGALIIIPTMVVASLVIGWLLARNRVDKPLRFSLFFAVALSLLGLSDLIYVLSDTDAQAVLFAGQDNGAISFAVGSILVRPVLCTIALLVGFMLSVLWRRLFERQPAPTAA